MISKDEGHVRNIQSNPLSRPVTLSKPGTWVQNICMIWTAAVPRLISFCSSGQHFSLSSEPQQSACSFCSFSQLSSSSPCQRHMHPSGGTWKTGQTTCTITSRIWMQEVPSGLVYWVQLPHLNLDFWKDSWALFSLQPLQPQPQLLQSVLASLDWD